MNEYMAGYVTLVIHSIGYNYWSHIVYSVCCHDLWQYHNPFLYIKLFQLLVFKVSSNSALKYFQVTENIYYEQFWWCLHLTCLSSNDCSLHFPWIDSKPLFLFFSFYLLVCFKFVLSLLTMHFLSLTWVFYTGLEIDL